jgi:hypothetical protein
MGIVVDQLTNVLMVLEDYLVLLNLLDVMSEMQMTMNMNLINDIVVVEQMIANLYPHFLMMLIHDVDFLAVIVKQKDHVHLLLIHVFEEQMNDVVLHLLEILYLN